MFTYRITSVTPIERSIDSDVTVLRMPHWLLEYIGFKPKFLRFRGCGSFWVLDGDLEIANLSWCNWLDAHVLEFIGKDNWDHLYTL